MEPIYENPLRSPEDIAAFVLEGQASVTFPNGRMRLANALDESLGQQANFVLWCDHEFPDDVIIEWSFWPIREPGLCMLFFAAKGLCGQDLFDPRLQKRSGEYPQYNNGDINALHVSYFRRKHAQERAFHTCNLRKSKGFFLVSQGADPLPGVEDADAPYTLQVRKARADVSFSINGLPIFHWQDDGQTYGEVLTGGKIGFRQMAPMIGEYADLRVYRA